MAITVDIRKKAGSFQLDVSFSLEKGTMALLGASGCGKSMTLRCIAGIETPDAGRIIIDGETVFDSERKINLPPQKRQVGLLFQNYALFPNMTVFENIACGIREKISKEKKTALIEAYVRKFHLEGLENHFPGQLSGGQKQRTALARMLIGKPRLLMLDEPFSALDSHLRWELERELLSTLSEYDGTVLFVSHDRDEVYRICQQVAIYNQGRLDVQGDKWEIFQSPRTRTAAALTGCKNIGAARWLDGRVYVDDWGLSLPAADPGRDFRYLGVRARMLKPGKEPGERTYPYEILQEIQGAFSDILMISLGAGASPLRWEITKETRRSLENQPRLVEFPEEAVLFLGE